MLSVGNLFKYPDALFGETMDPSIHLAERRERRGKRISALALLVITTMLGAAVVGLFGFLEADAAFGTVLGLEDRYICDADDYALDFPEIGQLSEIYTSDDVLLGKLTLRNSQPAALEDIPDTVKYAVLAAEDADFYEHEGVDFKAILRAALENAGGGGAGLQGGSTITQQVVKLNFLSTEQTIERKLCEAVIAAELERRHTKDEILEFYLNSVFYGENAYGVKAAAAEYFGKDLDRVTIAEAAAMVTPIRNPSLYDLRDNPIGVVRARNDVITQMENHEFITPAEAEAARREPLRVIKHQEFEELAPQVVIAAREELLRDPSYGLGETYLDRRRALFGCPAEDTECEGGGGLKVTVTVNYELQIYANELLKGWFKDPTGPTGAIAMVDNRSGAVKVMASGLEFGDDVESGQRPYDLATKGRRQAGSAFKPFALAAALESGAQSGWAITLGTHWSRQSPMKLECPYVCSAQGNTWTVRNFSSNTSGVQTLEEATISSTNTVYAQIALAVGPEKIVEMAHRLGIESPLNPVPSIVLGSQSVSPLEMAAAYSTLSNFGEKVESYLIERVEDRSGNVVYQHETTKERVLNEALAAAEVAALEKVVSQGTATRARLTTPRPQGGKTGTAQNFRDVWFMGFIPQYTTAVWVGHPDAQIAMENFKVYPPGTDGQAIGRATGGTVAAPIWKVFMDYVTAELEIEDFPEEPPGTDVYRRVPLTEVPDISGLSLEDAKQAIFSAGLFAEVIDVPSLEPEGTILGVSPPPGTTLEQGRTVSIRVSTGELVEMIDIVGVRANRVEKLLTDFNEESGAGVTWIIREVQTEDRRQWGRVIRTRPTAGEFVDFGIEVVVVVGVPPSGNSFL